MVAAVQAAFAFVRNWRSVALSAQTVDLNVPLPDGYVPISKYSRRMISFKEKRLVSFWLIPCNEKQGTDNLT
jgi:hypothetical protein